MLYVAHTIHTCCNKAAVRCLTRARAHSKYMARPYSAHRAIDRNHAWVCSFRCFRTPADGGNTAAQSLGQAASAEKNRTYNY